MQKINNLINQAKDNIKEGQQPKTSTLLRSSESLTSDEIVKINNFFSMLRIAFTDKFTHAFKNDNEIKMAKRYWADSVLRIDDQYIELGFDQIKREQEAGGLEWLNIAKIWTYFDPLSLSETEINELYHEYCNGGIEIKQNGIVRTGDHAGQKVAIKSHMDWSTGEMEAVSGLLGTYQMLEQVHGKHTKSVFIEGYKKILARKRNGEVFKKTELIEDDSNRKPDMNGYHERNENKKMSAIEKIKAFRTFKDNVNLFANAEQRKMKEFSNNEFWQQCFNENMTAQQAVEKFKEGE